MDQHKIDIQFTLNGQKASVRIPAEMTAVQVIRDVMGLKGTKEGCGIGECGACTIEVDGKAINSCLMCGVQLDGRKVLTVEGLEKEKVLHPIQETFLEHHAVQCGFCTPGILMSTHALLKENPAPDDDEIRDAVAGNLCRCTGYQQIFSSIKVAMPVKNGTFPSDNDLNDDAGGKSQGFAVETSSTAMLNGTKKEKNQGEPHV
ncbi:(2Fe-2S)-binding protein [Desulfocicer niacini]